MFKRNMVLLISIIFLLSMINARDEDYGFGGAVAVSLLACLAPFSALCMVNRLEGMTIRPLALHAASYIIGAVGVMMYAYYAINGKTDPEGAAHMHVIVFPALYLMVSALLVFFARLIEGYAKEKP